MSWSLVPGDAIGSGPLFGLANSFLLASHSCHLTAALQILSLSFPVLTDAFVSQRKFVCGRSVPDFGTAESRD